ncbi:MAG: drug resistance transporter, EmrB/QacA subfamily [Gammaproteobacteria bacterium]|nr:drug resistance transporter, EmrB/QacA subfamily [Gammaproteobacteria bacterium]
MIRSPYKYLIAVIYTVALFLDRLDLTIVNITLPTVAKVFHVSIVATDWVNLSFLLALAISIPISNWLAERFGFKKIYILSMVLFGLGSMLCAFANNLNTLIFLRSIHGIGGGMLIPVGMTMIYKVFDKLEYASITSFTFIPSLIAPAIAPFLGGILLESFGWRSVFLFSGPICLILATISILYLKEEVHQVTRKLDWLGFVLSATILMSIFYLLSQLGKNDLSFVALGTSTILFPLIVLFIWWENKTPFPLINLDFFKKEVFIKANLIQLCFQTCHLGAIFLVGMYLQLGIGLSASLAGLMMGMQAVGAMITSRPSVKLFNAYGPKLPIAVGLLGVAILSPCILLIKAGMTLFAFSLFFIRGIFSGLCGTPIQTLSVIGFSKEEIGSVNTIFNACRQVSISFGVAISSVFLGLGLKLARLSGTPYIPHNKVFSVFSFGFFIIPVVAVLGIALILSLKTYERIT